MRRFETRLWFAARALALILAGLVLVASVGPRWGRRACVIVASAIAVLVELPPLCHEPALDLFRTTLAAQLLFGRLFSPWNILVYEVGILAMARLSAKLSNQD